MAKEKCVPHTVISEGYGPTNPKDEGYIYILQSEDGKYTKIGLSRKDPEYRIRQIGLKLPFKVCLLYVLWSTTVGSDEKIYHTYFTLKNKHLNGEWFNLTDEDIDNIVKHGPEIFRMGVYIK